MRTRVFKNGNSLAVRLPSELALPEGEVEIERRGNELIIRPVESTLIGVWEALCSFSDDFMIEGREQPPIQERQFDFD